MSGEDQARYMKAAHSMQTAVAMAMTKGIGKETDPKHLRVGVNSAMVSNGALVELLIEKGIITLDEYEKKLADAMEREVESYRKMMNLPPNVHLY